jgi:general secretion pathway protein K
MSPSAGLPMSRGPQRGFIIVAVLWMLAALATLASIYSVYASNSAAASHGTDDRLQTEASMLAGVELVTAQLTGAPEASRPSLGAFALRLGRSKISVSYQTEGGRIDLNAAPKELLAGLFMTVGLDGNRAAYCADRIIAWRKKGNLGADDDEAFAYRSAGYSYPPRQAPFQNVRELPLVLGLSDEIVQRILPFVTVFNGRAEIDALSAAPECCPPCRVWTRSSCTASWRNASATRPMARRCWRRWDRRARMFRPRRPKRRARRFGSISTTAAMCAPKW